VFKSRGLANPLALRLKSTFATANRLRVQRFADAATPISSPPIFLASRNIEDLSDTHILPRAGDSALFAR